MRGLATSALLLSLVFALAACASTGSQGKKRADPNEITLEQIAEAGPRADAYSLVQNLRPQWLRKRGRQSISSSSDIVVYVGSARLGGPDVLRQVDVQNVASMEFLSPAKATNRFGGGHEHGAIRVILKSR